MREASMTGHVLSFLAAGWVQRTNPDGVVWVLIDRHGEAELACRSLPDAADVRYAPGDELLIWVRSPDHGVVLARLSAACAADDATPDTLVLEARTSLTLKVGDGSITIREDGSILIKGKDLVSHAKRRNRIRGGSVEIN